MISLRYLRYLVSPDFQRKAFHLVQIWLALLLSAGRKANFIISSSLTYCSVQADSSKQFKYVIVYYPPDIFFIHLLFGFDSPVIVFIHLLFVFIHLLLFIFYLLLFIFHLFLFLFIGYCLFIHLLLLTISSTRVSPPSSSTS